MSFDCMEMSIIFPEVQKPMVFLIFLIRHLILFPDWRMHGSRLTLVDMAEMLVFQ